MSSVKRDMPKIADMCTGDRLVVMRDFVVLGSYLQLNPSNRIKMFVNGEQHDVSMKKDLTFVDANSQKDLTCDMRADDVLNAISSLKNCKVSGSLFSSAWEEIAVSVDTYQHYDAK